MSETGKSNELPEKKLFKISSLEDRIFNSKLFIDLDSTDEQSLNNSHENESENSNEINDINNDYFLIKELLEELDSPKSDTLKEENDINYSNSLLPLINNGYEFVPKGYKNNNENNSKKNNKIYNKYNMINENNKIKYYVTKNKTIKERKGDWTCKLCLNLNFSFRKICNRCKTSKEDCIKKN